MQPAHKKLALLILAHEHPSQFGKLLEAIAPLNGHCFVHVDAKVDITPFRQLSKRIPNVLLCEHRVSINWAGYSMVQATLNLINEARTSGVFDRYVLLSGTCLPCQSMQRIRETLDTDLEYIDARLIDPKDHSIYFRINRYHLIDHTILNPKTDPQVAGTLGASLRSYLANFRSAIPAPNPFPLRYYYGSQFWALTARAIDAILDYSGNPDNRFVIDRFRFSFCPDEAFFQTILLNSMPHLSRRNGLHYVDWSDDSKARGKFLRMEHLPAILSSGKLFARKFHPVDSRELQGLLHDHVTG
ncbi:beta-1,6-N-acetylglucosaminyltransferase [Panacagrimonas sp.]|uniref:beta-1,6-N-acetylglucosaminyltransferase n=1 Tax=Panacagrimonas sp. TaxID=2480088 RepID=UPI003B51A092